ncbi:MAG TPA: DUF202 domain-containing protein [Terriglobales bacterium]|nr:DUF202 domain-containing protein [Terriglobales bacterium]
MNQGQQDNSFIPNRLAKDLTALSNERTLLSYVRTGLAFFATGMALVRFFVVPLHVLIGEIFIPLGCAVIVIGGIRFLHVRRAIQRRW